MNKVNLGDTLKAIYELLSSLSPEDRKKVFASVVALFNDEFISVSSPAPFKQSTIPLASSNSTVESDSSMTAKDYFISKSPENRGENLAVAARFVEITQNKEIITKEDIQQAFKDARRNFDSSNFSRDMRNAVHNAKFFMSGGERETYRLSFYGQEYVDSLPDRDRAKTLKKPGNLKKK